MLFVLCAFTLGEQADQVIGIFNILVASVAARMLGDEFLASVNDDSVVFDTQFQQCAGVFESTV
ncbi:MAG: hypothetical protein WB696_30665 [Chthoniobacterales bacterium]